MRQYWARRDSRPPIMSLFRTRNIERGTRNPGMHASDRSRKADRDAVKRDTNEFGCPGLAR